MLEGQGGKTAHGAVKSDEGVKTTGEQAIYDPSGEWFTAKDRVLAHCHKTVRQLASSTNEVSLLCYCKYNYLLKTYLTEGQ